MPAPPELKATLNLPRTDFPMKANLPQSEPRRLAAWEREDLYEKIRGARQGAPMYLLHDGPPYANGPLHLGHALNKCLKDFVVKSKTMAGFDAPYVPGWDCHGLPIEIKVDEQLGRKKLEMEPIAVRRACRKYAQKYLDLQRSQFQRLGVLGRFSRPYSTMTPEYESKVIETLFQFLENGFVYKGLRPVYWCIFDRTALAEAEVEYEMHTSPSVYVRYRLTSAPEAIDPRLAGRRVSTIIWTTTPWTLPASLAVAFHPGLEYVALEHGGDVYIVAQALAEATRQACNLEGAVEIASFPGLRMDLTTFEHPFLERSVLGVLADYVTTDQGTGVVHTAPAHGADDFYTGARYGLSQVCEVDNAGRMHGLPDYEGLTVFEANEPIIALLAERGALLGRDNIYHSYPHCWRCHNPVIFRATEQWFIGMETAMAGPGGAQTTFRRRALEEITRVQWDPKWGEERISNMVASRPDWCISRQRIWGVPIAVFLCRECHKPLNDPAINRRIVDLFAAEGADAWYVRSAEEILPAGTRCPSCGAEGGAFQKEMDILDVWFESGASQAAVLGVEPGLTWPADLYLEGGDQHRGWFQSSLLCAVGTRGAAPYRMAVTCGWTLDEEGRAMSKSLGNGVDPVDVADRMGAETVRLWVASVDFREDMAASENLMQRAAENYRKLRNTFRYLLGNLNGFEPESDAVRWEQMAPLDQYMLTRTRQLTEKVLLWYQGFEFHRVYHALNEFATSELSAFYIDAIKDRMYTFAPRNIARRSAQTVLWTIAEALVRLVAPLISFTADEVWQYLPPVVDRASSVHLELFPLPSEIAPDADPAWLGDWTQLLMVRDEALKSLEEARQAKRIGKALEAKLRLQAPPALLGVLERYQGALKEILNVSQVELGASETLQAITLPADGAKCERCWNYSTHVGEDARWPTVCDRCAAALTEMGFAPMATESKA